MEGIDLFVKILVFNLSRFWGNAKGKKDKNLDP